MRVRKWTPVVNPGQGQIPSRNKLSDRSLAPDPNPFLKQDPDPNLDRGLAPDPNLLQPHFQLYEKSFVHVR